MGEHDARGAFRVGRVEGHDAVMREVVGRSQYLETTAKQLDCRFATLRVHHAVPGADAHVVREQGRHGDHVAVVHHQSVAGHQLPDLGAGFEFPEALFQSSHGYHGNLPGCNSPSSIASIRALVSRR